MPVTHLTDFPDRLSPMLVKELRQGMRARGFTILFLVFELLLAFILLTAGSAAGSESAGAVASSVIFTMFIIAVLFIQPMRGISALSGEISGNTIEMMVLTRLSASRILLGKWIAIVSQSALILITIIPYLILRYFYGGMILLGELVFLTLIFLTSIALTALMVGLSGNSTKLIRVIPVLGLLFVLGSVPDLLFGHGGFNHFMSFCAMSDWDSRIAILAYVTFISYIGWCSLSFGISSIAPVVENHSTIRRVVALVLALVAAAVGLLDSVETWALVMIFTIILAPAVLTALTEPSILLPPVCKPFLTKGLPGRAAAIFLLPGWPAGVFYTTLIVGIAVAGVVISSRMPNHHPIDSSTIIPCLAISGGILLPALLTANFSKQESKRFTNFLIFTLASIILTIIPSLIAGLSVHPKLLWLFVWNPPVLLGMLNERAFETQHVMAAAVVLNVVYLLGLLITAVMAYRGYGRIFKEAEDEISSTKP